MTTEYRLLNDGEQVQHGDEVFLPYDKQWVACMCDVDHRLKEPFYPHRRKLAQPDFRWIPVKEKLPPPYQTVCCTSDPHNAPGSAAAVWSDFIHGGGIWMYYPERERTHWCPLPPPPKPEPTREDRQVEAFERAMNLKLPAAPSTSTVACNISHLGDALRQALAVT